MPTKKKAPARKTSRSAKNDPALIVVVPDGRPVPESVTAFASALEPSREVLFAEHVKEGLALRARTPTIFLNDTPEVAIAAAMEAGENVDDALANWKAETATLLSELKSSRRKVAMISRQAFVASPEQSAKALCAALRLKVGAPLPGGEAEGETGGVVAFLASHLIEADPEARELADAVAGVVAPPRHALDPVALSQFVQGGNVAGFEEELQLLRDDIAEMQSRLEQRVLNASLRQTAEEAAENRRVQIAEHAADRQNVLGAGLLALSKQRDAAAAELAGLRKEFDEQRHKLETAEAKLEDIYRSRSWKLTAPMRAVRLGLNRT